MRKIIVLALFIMIILGGCQQREKQKNEYQYPAGAVQTPFDIKHLQEAANMAPGNADAWIALGNALMDSSRFNEAIDAYQKALAIDPKNVDARVDMGTCYRKIGRPERAIEEYKKGLKINPNHLNGHKNSGVVLAFDLNKPAQAIKEFEKYLELSPNAQDAEQVRQAIRNLKASK